LYVVSGRKAQLKEMGSPFCVFSVDGILWSWFNNLPSPQSSKFPPKNIFPSKTFSGAKENTKSQVLLDNQALSSDVLER